jgi:hypothetical protein
MSTEQHLESRLARALGRVDDVEPSPDLWWRVVHSIEEDQQHRRRVVRTAIGTSVVVAALVLVGALALTTGPSGSIVRWQVMETLETVALVCLIVALGPGIRRFGRGYAGDLFTSDRSTADALLRLLDLAYYLVFAGYAVATIEPLSSRQVAQLTLAAQLGDAAERIGLLLVAMGLLHAITLVAMPVMALVLNSTRTGRHMPRWIWIVLAIAAWQLVGLLFLFGGIAFQGD